MMSLSYLKVYLRLLQWDYTSDVIPRPFFFLLFHFRYSSSFKYAPFLKIFAFCWWNRLQFIKTSLLNYCDFFSVVFCYSSIVYLEKPKFFFSLPHVRQTFNACTLFFRNRSTKLIDFSCRFSWLSYSTQFNNQHRVRRLAVLIPWGARERIGLSGWWAPKNVDKSLWTRNAWMEKRLSKSFWVEILLQDHSYSIQFRLGFNALQNNEAYKVDYLNH